MSQPRPTWVVPEPASALAALAATRRFGLGHPLVAQVLLHRGLVGEDLAYFLTPDLSRLHDPSLLRHLDGAVRVMDEAIRSGRKITVYGDYDVDGTTATSLLVSYLRSKGADVNYFIPMRNEGYGVTRASLDKIFAEQKPELMITVDCGTSSRAEIEYARSRGVEVIVTDHHQPTPGKEATGLVVNPWLSKDTYPNWHLAGVAVAYKLVAAHYGKHPVANLDFVALGTVADVMPLAPFDEDLTASGGIGVERHDAAENRILVRAGLERLAHQQVRGKDGSLKVKRPGLEALLRKSVREGLQVCPHGTGLECFPMRAETIGFQIGPRINAIGRMGLDPNLVVELLTTEDAERGAEIAELLHTTNIERREVTDKLVEEALGLVDPTDPVIVLQMDLFKGVAGLVAGRLATEFGKPAIVIDNEGHGSARSARGVPLLDVLQRDYSHLVRAAGHQEAMGISNVSDVEGLRTALAGHPWPTDLAENTLDIDAVVDLADLDMRLATALERLEPTGNANPAPLFALSGVKVASVKVFKERHVKLAVADADGRAKQLTWFGGAKHAPAMGDVVDVAVRVNRGYDWRDPSTRVVDLFVTDVRPSSQTLPVTLREAA